MATTPPPSRADRFTEADRTFLERCQHTGAHTSATRVRVRELANQAGLHIKLTLPCSPDDRQATNRATFTQHWPALVQGTGDFAQVVAQLPHGCVQVREPYAWQTVARAALLGSTLTT